MKPETHVERILSKRQLEVFTLLGQGKSPVETGKILFISPKTVSTHRNDINERMGFKHINHLIFYYLKFVEEVK